MQGPPKALRENMTAIEEGSLTLRKVTTTFTVHWKMQPIHILPVSLVNNT